VGAKPYKARAAMEFPMAYDPVIVVTPAGSEEAINDVFIKHSKPTIA
jgi:hypothetical protein